MLEVILSKAIIIPSILTQENVAVLAVPKGVARVEF